MNEPDYTRIEDFIKTLSREELSYINRLVVERLKLLSQLKTSEMMTKFNLGEFVEFETDDGRTISGMIVKLNKKTVSVKTADGYQWNVYPGFLRVKK